MTTKLFITIVGIAMSALFLSGCDCSHDRKTLKYNATAEEYVVRKMVQLGIIDIINNDSISIDEKIAKYEQYKQFCEMEYKMTLQTSDETDCERIKQERLQLIQLIMWITVFFIFILILIILRY